MQLSGCRVLLVEDDFFIQLDMQNLLEGAGANVTAASTVAEGMDRARAEYDAAVLDIRLPDGEVFPVADALDRKHTPIIFHSGNIDLIDLRSRFPNAVALSKPVDEEHLIATVVQYRKHA